MADDYVFAYDSRVCSNVTVRDGRHASKQGSESQRADQPLQRSLTAQADAKVACTDQRGGKASKTSKQQQGILSHYSISLYISHGYHHATPHNDKESPSPLLFGLPVASCSVASTSACCFLNPPGLKKGVQVHLGFFATENEAARAYDRAAINKGARDGSRIITNMAIMDYEAELDLLRRVPRTALVDALANEQ